MREIIDRILEGKFEYECGKLEFADSKIELSVAGRTDYEGTFRIRCDSAKHCEGKIYSSDSRVICLTEEFEGNDVEIPYRFWGSRAEEGDVIKGFFSVISNMGEYSLPFVISVRYVFPDSTEGEIKNLFLFANLAKSHWEEAVKLFYLPEFVNVIGAGDTECLEAYRGLSANRGNEQNVEEFLIHINKKQKSTYSVNFPIVDISARMMAEAGEVVERELEITKKGWGYTAVNIECEGDFLFTEKTFLCDTDFLGSKCRLPVFIDREACHAGINSGKIYLFNSYFSLEVPVNVHIGSNGGVRRASDSLKKMVAGLERSYIDYRLKKIKKNVWLKEAGKYAERMVALDDEDIEARLFQIHVLITEERRSEAGWFLDHAEKMIAGKNVTDPAVRAYAAYLKSLIAPDAKHVKKAMSEVREIWSRNKGSWKAALFLYYMDEDFVRDPLKAYGFLQKSFELGCTSPLMYAEALLLVLTNPTLIERIGKYELQLLWFAARNDVITLPLLERIYETAPVIKGYMPLFYRILCKIYEKEKDVRLLKEICVILIKGEKHGSEYLKWYRLGTEKQLRITNIYEYYLMSVDLDGEEEIPESVLIYFSYQSHLDQERRAYLYRYIYERRDKMPAIYEKYSKAITDFVSEQITKGVLNKHLAFLYGAILTEDLMGQNAAEHLSHFLYTEQLTVCDSRMKRVFLYSPMCEKAAEYELSASKSMVEVYGSNVMFVFEDAYGNRFLDSVEFTREKLMLPGKLSGMIRKFDPDNPYLELMQYEKTKSQGIRSDAEAQKLLKLAESGILKPEFLKSLLVALLEYFYDRDALRELGRCLELTEAARMDSKTREIALKYLISLGNYDKAFGWIKEYGPYFADSRSLMRLLDSLLAQRDICDRHLLYAAVYTFENGRYDSSILRFLVHQYRGTCRQMRDVWKAAGSFEVDTYELSERLLIQMMYTGAFVGDKLEIFRNYTASGAKDKVAKAFLMHCSYEYFVRERMTEEIIFDEMRRSNDRGEELPKVCKLAYLKYYAENREDRTDKKLAVSEKFLKEMLAEKIYLGFFREYTMFDELLRGMEDRAVVEYRTSPQGRARIHFCIVKDNASAQDYYAEYMRDVYGGVCFKDFVLFFGEKIQYYIMEEIDGEEKLTESGMLQLSDDAALTPYSRFSMINDMALSNAMGDYDTLDGLMEDFFRKEFYNGELFKLE